MERKTIQWDLDAWDDYPYWQAQDKRILKKINQLLRDICRNPFDATGSIEREPFRFVEQAN